MKKPRLIIADDSALMRQAFQMCLEADYEIVASVADGKAAVAAAATLNADLVLLDISMPVLDGLKAGQQIKLACPLIPLIFVSEHQEKSYIEAAFDTGGSGYVMKRNMNSELLPAIRDVLAGKEYGRLVSKQPRPSAQY